MVMAAQSAGRQVRAHQDAADPNATAISTITPGDPPCVTNCATVVNDADRALTTASSRAESAPTGPSWIATAPKVTRKATTSTAVTPEPDPPDVAAGAAPSGDALT